MLQKALLRMTLLRPLPKMKLYCGITQHNLEAQSLSDCAGIIYLSKVSKIVTHHYAIPFHPSVECLTQSFILNSTALASAASGKYSWRGTCSRAFSLRPARACTVALAPAKVVMRGTCRAQPSLQRKNSTFTLPKVWYGSHTHA